MGIDEANPVMAGNAVRCPVFLAAEATPSCLDVETASAQRAILGTIGYILVKALYSTFAGLTAYPSWV
jgi:hypothetical protein